MGLFDRLRGRRTQQGAGKAEALGSPQVHVLDGDDDLEVVGESNYQPALWGICNGRIGGEKVRHPIVAVLVPEPHNIHDSNAVAVHVEGHVVGYLDRQTAAVYVGKVHELMASHGAYVGLRGVIVGGGRRDDGPGRLGVWLEHDQTAFGLQRTRPQFGTGTMRTGFSEAWLTDADDDSYDLSWFDALPDADRPATAMLQDLLKTDPDPIDRHFQFAELEARLYRCRDLYDTALAEFDEVCRRHDAEMETICAAFMVKWRKVPLLETYRQMAIRQQKKKDWKESLWWAERGLALYGSSPAREDAVEDLRKRSHRARQKLESSTTTKAKTKAPVAAPVLNPEPAPMDGQVTATSLPTEIEVLTCGRCSSAFERLRVRGRKPSLCPMCRAVPA